MSHSRASDENLLEAAKFTIRQVEDRIALKQLPIATRMLLLALMSAIRNVEQERQNGKA